VPDAATLTLQRLMLGAELRHLRENRGMTIEQVSQELSEKLGSGFSTAKISRLETAKRGITLRDVRDLCDYYEVHEPERDRLVAMAKASRGNRLQGINEALSEYVALESIASGVYAYESMFIPGLLQTADYFRAIRAGMADLASGTLPDSDAQFEEKLAVRAKRQQRLKPPDSLRLYAVVDENVIRRHVGPPHVMAAQLRHVAEVSSYPNVTVRVVPIAAGAHPGFESAGFSILEFAEETRRSPACFVEGAVGALWAEREADRQRMGRVFHHLESLALDADASRAMIDAATAELE
jgi:transcriptional regulator with XRE-family HTH domain